jgi:proline racemase
LGSVLRVRVAEAPRFVAEVARIQSERNIPVLIDKKGPASFLIPDLETVGVALTQVGLDEFIQASVDLVNAVEAADVEHGNYDDLNKAVAAAGWRPVGDRRAFARKKGDISALEAVTLAHWGTTNHLEVEPWAMHV